MKWTIAASVLAVVVLFILLIRFAPSRQEQQVLQRSTLTTRELAKTCTNDRATLYHIHAHLQIFVDGVEETVPGGVGITNDCMYPLHTHDTDGVIHVESPEPRDFTLGDFFAGWGVPLEREGFALTVVVDGAVADYVTSSEDQVLQDDQQIELRYIRD